VIGDYTYTPTEYLIPIYCGEAAKTSTQMDNLNFDASQLCIRIEMVFGLMINKWGILLRPLKTKVRKIKKILLQLQSCTIFASVSGYPRKGSVPNQPSHLNQAHLFHHMILP
jgi:hypothetical protein